MGLLFILFLKEGWTYHIWSTEVLELEPQTSSRMVGNAMWAGYGKLPAVVMVQPHHTRR
jgi:hypothetical protein